MIFMLNKCIIVHYLWLSPINSNIVIVTGPAYIAGLRAGDRIMEVGENGFNTLLWIWPNKVKSSVLLNFIVFTLQINRQDVSKLESTMLVPLLASLEDALNLVILRDPNIINGDE